MISAVDAGIYVALKWFCKSCFDAVQKSQQNFVILCNTNFATQCQICGASTQIYSTIALQQRKNQIYCEFQRGILGLGMMSKIVLSRDTHRGTS